MTTTPEDLAERLRSARAAANLSQQHVADSTGIVRSGLSDIEQGKRRVDALELAALAATYGQPVSYFLGDTPAAPSEAERLAQQLGQVTDNLHGYLAQRAHELAQPLIAAARAVADERVRVAQEEERRQRDLAAELRRQWQSEHRRALRAEHRTGAMHSGSDDCPTCNPTTERTDR